MTDDLHTDGSAPADAPPTPEPAGTAAADPPHRRLGIVAAVGVAVLVADQASKWWAVSRLSDGDVIDLVGSLRFNLFFNTGVAFSLGSDDGLGPWISVLAIGVVVAVSFGATSRYPLGAVASGLISGGAIGNLLDRAFRGNDGFLHGAVIDFIDLQWWPVFNIADAAIVVGAILLVIASFRVPQ
ncbi:signal peptidase II [Aquihabitans daechungensis]|uniref:signal peptidase II n=1 Tax=Aquihabitans daechungensis TaxID=1052257 RepID=UPI003BA0CF93